MNQKQTPIQQVRFEEVYKKEVRKNNIILLASIMKIEQRVYIYKVHKEYQSN